MASGRTARAFLLAGAAFALAAVLLAAAAPRGPGREGGVFRVAGVPDTIDPAITLDAGDALEASCAKLMTYPDAALPAGTRVEPEVATGYPAVSRDGRTYTFTIGNGFRFSTGERVTVKSFVRAMYRLLNPATNASWVQHVQDIVGAKDVMDGKATQASGIRVRGNQLIIRLTHAARDFPARMTFYAFCAVPADLPISAEGVGAPLPGAGPYYIAAFVSGQKLVLRRNPFYRGSRPHHVDEIDFIPTNDSVGSVETGAADYAELGSAGDIANLDPKYRSQLYAVPGIGVRYVVLNSSRPLFKDNPPLRQAVNFALDRAALLRARGANSGRLTDQYLPPSMPGFIDAKIYPLDQPNLEQAKALARGHTRSGRATLYIKDTPIDIAQSQIIQRDLRPLGIRVKVKKLPGPALFQQLFTPGSPYDMSVLGFGPDYWDSYAILDVLFNGRLTGTPYSFNISHFDSPKYNALLDAASRLIGSARYRAYGKLDVDLVRNAAPMVAYESESAFTFVSKRVGCVVLHPYLDFAAVCLK